MDVTDIDEGEPPDLALVRLLAVVPPTLRAPPPVKDENTPVPHPKEVEEREVRQAIQIGVTSQPTNRRSDTGITFADVEPAGRSNDSAPQRQTLSTLGVLKRSPNEDWCGNGDPGAHAGRVPGEALDITGAEATGYDLRRRKPYGSRNGPHSSSSSRVTGSKPRSKTERPAAINARTR